MTAGDKGSMIRIDGFRFSVRLPYLTGTMNMNGKELPQHGYNDISFSTELDVREGQKAVVGKSRVDNAGNALVLVVTAKGVD